MKKLILTLSLAVASITLNAQSTVEELKAEKAKKTAAAAKLQGEANALQAQIDAFPGWKFGTSGTVGANFSGFNNWYTNAAANSENGNIGISFNGFANLDREKDFWRSSLNVNLGWTKYDEDTSTDSSDNNYENTTDIFSITSLYGYKLSEKLAVSGLVEYRTSFSDFNDPGYLDFGAGITWTPLKELVVVIHPLNYNFVFSNGSSDYESSLGAKIVADYNKQIGKFKFRSNLSTFQSYEDSDLSNVTWVNTLGFNIWKGIGVGLESGLRANRQEAYNAQDFTDVTNVTSLSNTKNEIQSYWLVGLSYGF